MHGTLPLHVLNKICALPIPLCAVLDFVFFSCAEVATKAAVSSYWPPFCKQPTSHCLLPHPVDKIVVFVSSVYTAAFTLPSFCNVNYLTELQCEPALRVNNTLGKVSNRTIVAETSLRTLKSRETGEWVYLLKTRVESCMKSA